VKPKAVEILILVVILVLLSLSVLAFMDIRNDEAEAFSDNIFEITEPNDFPFVIGEFREVWLSLEIEDKPNFGDGNRVFLYQSDEFDIVIEKNESNEPEILVYTFEEEIEAILNDNTVDYQAKEK